MLLRKTAVVAAWVGAAGSLAAVTYSGRNSPVRFVLGPMFAVWVAAPFAALLLVARASRSWSGTVRAALFAVTILVSAATLAIYAVRILAPPNAQGAFVFVAVPPASIIIAAAVLLIVMFWDRRVKRSP